MRKFMIAGSMMLALSLVLVFAARAQDQGTPAATPGGTLCATPVAEAEGTGTPVTVVAAPTTAADPGGSDPGTPIGLFPCATPDSGTGGSDQGTSGQTLSTSVTVEMIDIAFEPKDFTIPANTDVTITLPNNGIAVHNFNVDELGIASGDVPGGGSTTVTINAPAGTYTYFCGVPGHKEAGMAGTITVQ